MMLQCSLLSLIILIVVNDTINLLSRYRPDIITITLFFYQFILEPTLKSKVCLKCLYFTKIISALCCYLEYFSYLYTIN